MGGKAFVTWCFIPRSENGDIGPLCALRGCDGEFLFASMKFAEDKDKDHRTGNRTGVIVDQKNHGCMKARMRDVVIIGSRESVNTRLQRRLVSAREEFLASHSGQTPDHIAELLAFEDKLAEEHAPNWREVFRKWYKPSSGR